MREAKWAHLLGGVTVNIGKREFSRKKKEKNSDTTESGLWRFEARAAHDVETLPIDAKFPDYKATGFQVDDTPENQSPVFKLPQTRLKALQSDLTLPTVTRLRLRMQLALANASDQITQAVTYEWEAGNLFNFAPAALALGILSYFSAGSEPHFWVLFASILVSAIVPFVISTRGMLYLACCTLLLFFVGMGVAKLQIGRTQMPVPLSQMTANIKGIVSAVDQNKRGAPRYLIRPTMIEGLEVFELPRQIRLSSAKNNVLFHEGDAIEGLARMSPISGPAFPGGYDFAFASRMNGLGMSGFFMGSPEPGKAIDSSPAGLRSYVSMSTQQIRRHIAGRIRAGLSGEAGEITVALIIGDRSGLSEETQESLRRSGLAHILAISGLHMALVTLTVIWLVRIGLVLIPGFADRFPVKKLAILSGFVTATAYLLISGQGIATQRAWLMISVMLAASMLDRRAITMRSVAIAALIILLISPTSVFQPGFQMSFAAVAALVAVYREWSDTRVRRSEDSAQYFERSFVGRMLRQAGAYLGGLTTTSLIAGGATALFALWHFHRVAPMGLASNLAAMPVVSIAVMPLALATVLLMPYGFEQLALKPLGASINAVLSISERVNAFGLDFEVGVQPVSVLACSACFLLFACGFRSRLRLLAIIPLVGVVLGLSQTAQLPDILVAQDGRSIAVRSGLLSPVDDNGSGKGTSGEGIRGEGLALIYPGRGAFVTDIWRRAFLPNRVFDDLPDDSECSKDQCRVQLNGVHGMRRLQIVYDPDLLQKACKNADLLLAPRLWWVRCSGDNKPGLVLTRADLEARGSHIINLGKPGISIETAWHHSRSEFEESQLVFKRSNSRKALLSTMVAPPRPWQERFDNISRRFPVFRTR